MDTTAVSILTSSYAVILYRFLAVVFGIISTLVFAAPTLPFLSKYVRPREFETGWRILLTKWRLNQNDEGFEKVAGFIGEHIGVRENVADDCDASLDENKLLSNHVEEIRILQKPSGWSESILLCYDETTGGPPDEPYKTEYHGWKLPNTDESGEDWRWLGPLSAIEHNASVLISEYTQKWMAYGGVVLVFSVTLQLLALALEAI
ncbi:MAG TPA: hypothetical protein VFJ06_00350 [Halococcus sp.]|nr:hypothetical protein [Halococcus sp.]